MWHRSDISFVSTGAAENEWKEQQELSRVRRGRERDMDRGSARRKEEELGALV